MSVPGQRPKAKEKSCQYPHLSGTGAPGECLMDSWAAYEMSFLFWRKNMLRKRLAGLLLIGIKRRSLPHRLPSMEIFFWGKRISFENGQPFPTDLPLQQWYDINCTLACPKIPTPMPQSLSSSLPHQVGSLSQTLFSRGAKSEYPKDKGIGVTSSLTRVTIRVAKL